MYQIIGEMSSKNTACFRWWRSGLAKVLSIPWKHWESGRRFDYPETRQSSANETSRLDFAHLHYSKPIRSNRVNSKIVKKSLFCGKLKIYSRNFVASRFTILHVRYSSRDSYLNCTMGKCVPFRPKVRYLAKHLKSEEGNLLLSSLPSSLQASVLLHNYVTRRRLLMKGILLGIFFSDQKFLHELEINDPATVQLLLSERKISKFWKWLSIHRALVKDCYLPEEKSEKSSLYDLKKKGGSEKKREKNCTLHRVSKPLMKLSNEWTQQQQWRSKP